MTDTHVIYLSHHWILLAGPAFLPALIVVGVIVYVAIRDRRSADSSEQTRPDDKRD